MQTLYAKGAYGRTAKREDWDAGKDFQVWFGIPGQWQPGPYFSNRDIPELQRADYCEIIFTDAQGITRFTVKV